MADSFSTDELFASPSPSPAAPAPQAFSTDDLFKQPDSGLIIPGWASDAVNKVTDTVKGAAKSLMPDTTQPSGDLAPEKVITESFGQAKSTVGSWLDKLMIPLNIETGALIRGLDHITPGIKQATMPEGGVVPNTSFNDITDYYFKKYFPSPEDAMKYAISKGASANVAAFLSGVYQTIPAVAGLGANIVGDPLNVFAVGTLTKEAEALRKSGVLGEETRNLVELKVPFSDTSVAISQQSAANAIKSVPFGAKALDTASAIKDKAYDMVRGFDLRTGDPRLDLEISTHAGRARGAGLTLKEEFIDPYHKMDFSVPERDLITKVVESTPNIAPNVPEKIISAAKGKAGLEEEAVQQLVAKEIQKAKGDLALVPGREDDIAKQIMAVKQLNAKILEKRFSAGLLNEENAAQQILENYLVHKADPAALKAKNAEEAAAITEEAMKAKVNETVRGTALSSFDTGKIGRKVEGTLAEATAKMKKAKGIDNYYIQDPVYATGLKYLETEKLLRDKKVLDYLASAPYARDAGDKLARAAGFKPILHPDFGGKTFVFADGTEKVLNKLIFPKEVASKASYYILPREVGNLAAYLSGYNRVYRGVLLASPGYYARNMMDNFIKNRIQGVRIGDYTDVLRVMSGKAGTLEVKAASGVRQIPMDAIRQEIRDLGIANGGQYKEGLAEALAVGKRMGRDTGGKLRGGRSLLSDQESAFHAKELLTAFHQMGERGENWTREALYLNRRRAGYSPEMAAHEVEKFLFDFSRNTKTTDLARLFPMPFVQHAIKTAFIAPEMLGKGPATYNTLHNKFMIALGRAFNDPVTQSEISELLPEWRKYQDVVAGPILPNTWFQRIMNSDKIQGTQIGSVPLFRQSMGLDILNMFDLFNTHALKTGMGLGPMVQAFAGLIAGKDIRLNTDVDINSNNPNKWHRIAWTVNSVLQSDSGFGFPNAWRMIKQSLGIGNPEYFTKDSILMLQGMFPQFGGYTNLDREYLGRVMAFQRASKELTQKLASAAIREAQGKTADLAIANSPGAFKAVYGVIRPDYSSTQVYQELMGEAANGAKAQYAAQALKKEYSIPELAGLLKNLERATKHNAEAYAIGKERYLQMLKAAKDDAERQALTQQMLMGGQLN